jgi:hypothetical protein
MESDHKAPVMDSERLGQLPKGPSAQRSPLARRASTVEEYTIMSSPVRPTTWSELPNRRTSPARPRSPPRSPRRCRMGRAQRGAPGLPLVAAGGWAETLRWQCVELAG